MTPQWTPDEISLARRIVAIGLPVPYHITDTDFIIVTLSTDENPERYYTPGFGYDPATRIMWTVVATDAGVELLPVLTDPMLLGWLITELERVTGAPVDIWREWGGVLVSGAFRPESNRLLALTVALEAAKVAA